MELTPKLKRIEHRQFSAEYSGEGDTIELSASSDTPYLREFGYEVLDHSQKSVDLSRLLANAPVLIDHSGDQVGAVKKAWLAGNKLRATVQFSKSVRGQEIEQDIKDGIRSNVSIGYMVNKFTKQKDEMDGIPVYRATSWQPMEISIVSVPADYSVGVGRSIDGNEEVDIPTDDESVMVTEEVIEVAVEEQKDVEEMMKTEDQMIVIAEDVSEMPVSLVEEKTEVSNDTQTLEQAAVDADERSVQPAIHSHIQVSETNMKNNEEMVVNTNIALTDKEQKEYSLARAIYNLSKGNRSGFEFEISQEIEKKSGIETTGLWVPTSMKAQRAIAIGDSNNGQNLTFTSAGEFIDFLRNKTVVAKLGAQLLSLPSKLALPRATTDNVANWVAEDGAAITPASQSFDQVTLSPKKLIAQTAYSLETLRVANFDIEQLTRNNMYASFATAFDKAALQGTSNSPTGLTSLTGLVSGSHTSGSALTYASAMQLLQKVQEANADNGTLKFVTTPAIYNTGKTTIRSGSTAQFIITDDNKIAGYDVHVSNNLPATYLAFGNWEECILAEFGALEIIVDPYTSAGSGKVVLTAQMLGDIAFKHVRSFAVQKNVV